MKKKMIIVIILVLAIAAVTLFMCFRNNNRKENTVKEPGIVVREYNYSLDDSLVKEIPITDKTQEKALKKIRNEINLKDLPDSNLAISSDIVVEYNDNSKLIIQNSITDYCYYTTNEFSGLINMPAGLLELVSDILK